MVQFNDMNLDDLRNLQEIVNVFLDQSNSAIIKNNFITNFYKYTINGYLYGNFKLFGTKSFRLTSSHPNLLNMPATGSIYAKPLNRCFRAKKDRIFYMVDLSALEDRVIANLSRDKNKCAIFTQGIDGHCLNSYFYFKKKIEAILPRKENESDFDYVKRYKQAIDDGNKILKAIRQAGKPCTFGLSYGAYPPKIANSAKIPLEEAEKIFNNYHNVLYKSISTMRDKVEEKAKKNGYIHLGLGCCINTSDPEKEIRTIFNACSQFWSIITALVINKMHTLIDEAGLEDNVKICCAIYDSIKIDMKCDPVVIKWVNDNIIPLITTDLFTDTIVHNEAEGEIGFNWYDTVAINNGASIEEITKAINEARQLLEEAA